MIGRALAVLVLAAVAAGPARAADTPSVPAVGAAAPDVVLTNDRGETTKLSDYRGKWVVLYFYPKDFTSGCTLEAQNFQRDLAKYEQAGAVVLGVSIDDADSHRAFGAKEGLGFRLLSDPDAATSAAYGSVISRFGTRLAARNTFIIDPQGKIAQVFTGVDPAEHSGEVLSALATLQRR
ncbi:MAG TPA: peroxiredoxin [Candidatus Eisenbacteria bacterium]|nr:peroxiredoxin [Candidatus Eisenbacteria bacterium]